MADVVRSMFTVPFDGGGTCETAKAGGSSSGPAACRAPERSLDDGLGLLSYGGQTDDRKWLFILVDEQGRGAWAVAETDGEAKRIVCEELDLDKATVLGGRWAKGGG